MNQKTINYRLCGWMTAILLLGTICSVQAGEIGHFAPGVLNIRDFVVPEPGIYGAVYNYFYMTDRLNDADGNEIDSVTIYLSPDLNVTLGVDVNVDAYALALTAIWVTPWRIFDAKYAAYISPSLSNTSVAAALSTITGSASIIDESTFGVADLFVQPVWLGWTREHWDFALGYGFYAPVGKYSTEIVDLPIIGPITTEANDNIGLGFWTHQFQGAVSWYPSRMEGGTAAALAFTYEMNGNKKDFDITPGDVLTINWGASQFLPLNEDQTLLTEIGPKGYSTWQVTDDTGTDAFNSHVHDQVHAIGGQLGLSYVPWASSVTFQGNYEFHAVDRFQGYSFGINIAKMF